MKKIAFVLYRKWAYDIALDVIDFQKECPGFIVDAIITVPSEDFQIQDAEGFPKIYSVDGKETAHIASILLAHEIDVVFYYGWSWLVKEPVLSRHLCLCLHPSLLPRYRGGSPIQHQIIEGEEESGVTLFRMGEGIDDGDIYGQLPLSLAGTLTDILERIQDRGAVLTRRFILDLVQDAVVLVPQSFLEENLPLRRRKPEESEVRVGDIESLTYDQLNNRVRALADPYPNVFVAMPEGKLLIQEIERCDRVPDGGVIVNDAESSLTNTNTGLYLRVSEGYARISRFRVANT